MSDGPICPYCEKKVSLDNLESEVYAIGDEDSEVSYGKKMYYCPHCGKILGFGESASDSGRL